MLNMLSEILVGFGTTTFVVVTGIAAAEGFKWAMRIQSKGQTDEINDAASGPKDVPLSASEQSVMSTLRDLGSSPMYPKQGSVLAKQAFGNMEMFHRVSPNSGKHDG